MTNRARLEIYPIHRIASTLAFTLTCFLVPIPIHADSTLVTVVPGMHDEADNSWLAIASMISPTKDRYVIQQEGVTTSRNLSRNEVNNVITIPTDATPDIIRDLVAPITGKDHATVIVDMNLGVSLSAGPINKDSWQEPEQWTTNVVSALAEQHLATHPDSKTMFIGHSAGTEPIKMLPKQVNITMASGEVKTRPLFDTVDALSSRGGNFPSNVVMVFKEGDFLSSPGGELSASTIMGSFSLDNAKALAKLGHTVLYVADEQHDAAMKVVSAALTEAVSSLGPDAAAVTKVVNFGGNIYDRMVNHRGSTDVSYPDQKMSIITAYSAEVHPLPTGSIASALPVATLVANSPAANIPTILDKLRESEPTPGIGGVSLNATAHMPIEPEAVSFAGYLPEGSCLYLKLRDGTTLTLPRMDPDVVEQSYETEYVLGEKAELSIGASQELSPEGKLASNLNSPGRESVYYFGHVERTQLGSILYDADDLLGRLAYGKPSAITEVQRVLPGFRTLAELFPEKYSIQPAQMSYQTADERIFLNSSLVNLEFTPNGRDLHFVATEFAVHFGQMGPAETAFASYLMAHFDTVAGTHEGRAFAQLAPYARAMAIFRWLKTNGINFQSGGLPDEAHAAVFTPTSVPPFEFPSFDDIAPHRPTVFFGMFGPTRIVLRDGRESRIAYHDGHVANVVRYDGAKFTVYRDDLNSPVGFSLGAHDASAFVADPSAGLLYLKHVDLATSDGEIGFKPRNDTITYPASNAEAILARAAVNFANGDVQ